MATIRIRDETYKRLNEAAGELRSRLMRPVSMDEVLESLLRENRLRSSDFAGSWSMTEGELKDVERGLEAFWRRWRLHAR